MSNSERSLKIGKYLVKLWARVKCLVFLTHSVLRETTNVTKQAINDKLQGSVATYLRCGGVANNQIKKGLLLSVRVNVF